MAKKARRKPVVTATAEEETFIYLLTLLMAQVQPKLDKGQAYPLLLEWLLHGSTDEELAESYGKRIASIGKKPAAQH